MGYPGVFLGEWKLKCIGGLRLSQGPNLHYVSGIAKTRGGSFPSSFPH